VVGGGRRGCRFEAEDGELDGFLRCHCVLNMWRGEGEGIREEE
jgi:hypothetical protein